MVLQILRESCGILSSTYRILIDFLRKFSSRVERVVKKFWRNFKENWKKKYEILKKIEKEFYEILGKFCKIIFLIVAVLIGKSNGTVPSHF